MGGWGSGPQRHGARWLVEDCRRLDLEHVWPLVEAKLHEARQLRRVPVSSGWGFRLVADEVPLPESLTITADALPAVTVELDYTWPLVHFVCPRCGSRRRSLFTLHGNPAAEKLEQLATGTPLYALLAGRGWFADGWGCRGCLGLRYASQEDQGRRR
jgi:hypothetical protein